MLMPSMRTGRRTTPNTTQAMAIRIAARMNVVRGLRPRTSDILCRLEPCVFGSERLLSNCGEADDEFRVVVERLAAQHGADAELRMSNAHSELQGQAGRLIFVLIGVGRRPLANLIAATATAGAVRIGPVLV